MVQLEEGTSRCLNLLKIVMRKPLLVVKSMRIPSTSAVQLRRGSPQLLWMSRDSLQVMMPFLCRQMGLQIRSNSLDLMKFGLTV